MVARMSEITPDAIPVAVHGFTWTTALVGVLNLLVGGALVSWIRSRPKMREIDSRRRIS
jgi:type IV secretory pathway TrbD component